MRIALFLTVVLAACSSEDPQDAVIDGAMVYGTPLTDGNTFACTHCHALEEPAEDNMLRAGHHIGGAPRRTSYKDGKLTSMLDAVNTCVTEWMGAPALAADDARFIALQTWLDAQAPAGSVDNVAISIAPAPADLTGGDAGRGKALFNQSCALSSAARANW